MATQLLSTNFLLCKSGLANPASRSLTVHHDFRLLTMLPVNVPSESVPGRMLMSDPLSGLERHGPGPDFDSPPPWQRGPVGAKLPVLLRQRATSLVSGPGINAAAAVSSQSRGQLPSAPLRAPDPHVAGGGTLL